MKKSYITNNDAVQRMKQIKLVSINVTLMHTQTDAAKLHANFIKFIFAL